MYNTCQVKDNIHKGLTPLLICELLYNIDWAQVHVQLAKPALMYTVP